MAFAAEKSRQEDQVVDFQAFAKSCGVDSFDR